ncbi:MAG TPA: hypothetical protein VFY43_03025 [Candidatus Limnocylindria bacterium]|nr:hypothetical protein [Candidatus Limnocylindria bacterium]
MTDDRSESIAAELRRRGLGPPALLLLEAHRPLRPLLSSLALFLQPLARPLLGTRVEALQQALDDDAAYDALLQRLAAPDEAG